MAQTIPSDFGSAALVFESAQGTQPFITTCGVNLSNAGGDYVEAANNVFSAYALTFMTSTTSDLTLTKCVLSVGSDGDGAPTVDSDRPSEPGTSTGDFLPLSCSLLVNKRTAVLGRKGRGRMFMPGLLKDNMVDVSGRVGNTTLDAYNGLLEDFMELLLTSGGIGVDTSPVLLHQGFIPVPTPITSFVCAPVIGTIRKRIR